MQNEVLQPFTVCKSCELNEDGRGGEGMGGRGDKSMWDGGNCGEREMDVKEECRGDRERGWSRGK